MTETIFEENVWNGRGLLSVYCCVQPLKCTNFDFSVPINEIEEKETFGCPNSDFDIFLLVFVFDFSWSVLSSQADTRMFQFYMSLAA